LSARLWFCELKRGCEKQQRGARSAWKSGASAPRQQAKKDSRASAPVAPAVEIFRAFAKAGRRLAEIHIHSEQQPDKRSGITNDPNRDDDPQ
jgi:hypothetical protein